MRVLWRQVVSAWMVVAVVLGILLIPSTASAATGTNTPTSTEASGDGLAQQGEALGHTGRLAVTEASGPVGVVYSIGVDADQTTTGGLTAPPGFAVTGAGAVRTATGELPGNGPGVVLRAPKPSGAISGGNVGGDGHTPVPFEDLGVTCSVYHHSTSGRVACIDITSGVTTTYTLSAGWQTTQYTNPAVVGNRLYYSATNGTNVRVFCFDASTLAGCGSINVWSGLSYYVATGAAAPVSDPVLAADGRLWLIRHDGNLASCNTALTSCSTAVGDPWGLAAMNVAAPSGVVGFAPNEMSFGMGMFAGTTVGARTYFTYVAGDLDNSAFGLPIWALVCVDPVAGACGVSLIGGQAIDGSLSNWTNQAKPFAVDNLVCVVVGTGRPATDTNSLHCVNNSTGAVAVPSAAFNSWFTAAATSPSQWFAGSTRVGNKIIWPVTSPVGSGLTDKWACWDDGANTPCANFGTGGVLSTGRTGLQQYGAAAGDNCLYSLGDLGVELIIGIDGSRLCAPPKDVLPIVRPAASYCRTGSSTITGWDAVDVWNLPAGSKTTITMKNSSGVGVFTADLTANAAGRATADISSIPFAGATTSLTVNMSITTSDDSDWGTALEPRVSVTWVGGPVEFCRPAAVAAECPPNPAIGAETAFTATANPVFSTSGNWSNNANTNIPLDISDVCSSDMSVTKVADIAAWNPGDTITYTLHATNLGPDTAVKPTLDDTASDGLTLQNVAVAATAGMAAPRCAIVTPGAAAPAGWTRGTLHCDAEDMAMNDAFDLTVTAVVDATWGAQLANDTVGNYVEVSSDPVIPDTDDTNNSDDTFDPTGPDVCDPAYEGCAVTPRYEADVKVTKNVTNTAPVQPGEHVGWTIDVSNLGPDPALDVVLTDRAGLGIASLVTATADNGGTCTITALTFDCDLGTIDVNETVRVTIDSVAVADAIELNGVSILWNYAKATSSTIDPVPTNNIDDIGVDPTNPGKPTDTECVADPDAPGCYEGRANIGTAVADVKVTKVADTTVPVQPGGQVDWTVTVENLGPDLAKNVVLTDRVGSGIAVIDSATADTGADCTIDGLVFSCAVGDLAIGDKVVVKVVTHAVDDAATLGAQGALWNYAKADSTTFDPVLENNDDDAGADPNDPGKPTDPVCVADPKAPECYEGRDDVPVAVADVKVTKVADTTVPVQPGGQVDWTVTVENLGPDLAKNVVLTDRVGSGIAVIDSATADTGADCTIDGLVFSCAVGDLAIGDKVVVKVVTHAVDDAATLGAQGALWNYAKADSTTFDPVLENNDDDAGADPNDPGKPTDPVCVADPKAPECYEGRDDVPVAVADVKVTKVATNTGPVRAGSEVGWTVTVENLGPDAAIDVIAEDTPDEWLTITGVKKISGPGECAVTGGVARCEIEELPAGAILTARVTSSVKKDVASGENVENGWAATSRTPDPNPDNNHDTDSVPISPPPTAITPQLTQTITRAPSTGTVTARTGMGTMWLVGAGSVLIGVGFVVLVMLRARREANEA